MIDVTWQVWITLAVVFVILEVLTTTFYAIFFAAGALAAAVLAVLGFSVSVQIIVAAVLAVLSLFLAKPLSDKLIKKSDFKAGAEGLVGKTGKVKKLINRDGEGIILVEGEEWRAKASRGGSFNEGDTVIVTSVESTKLIVDRNRWGGK